MMYYLWISLDPTKRKLDIYPKSISNQIEQAYRERDCWTPSSCDLGSNFFNATVHFHPSGILYQTTPGMSMGRAGFKQPGYRSVQRVTLNEGAPFIVSINCHQVHGEWRICKNNEIYQVNLKESITQDCLTACDENLTIDSNIKEWSHEDLDNLDNSTERVVWQWCRGITESEGNLLQLSDEWWCPYMYNENCIIENAFQENKESLNLTLPMQNGDRTIIYINNQPYARQIDDVNHKERLMRRVVKKVSEIKEMFEVMKNPPISISELIASLPEGKIPSQFYCCITQDVMKDPVTTIDGHTYDRIAILRWFEDHSTSPLTGLVLANKNLISNNALKEAIDKFISDLTSSPSSSVDNTLSSIVNSV